MEGMGEGKGALGEGLLLWLSPCTVPMQVVMRLCPYGSDTNATMPRTFDSSYHNVEVADVLHCLSPGTCSGDEALLSSGESGGGGAATPCKCPGPCQWLIQDFTLVNSGELQ